MYNADQLKSTCQQYIAINLAALLESRYVNTYLINNLKTPICGIFHLGTCQSGAHKDVKLIIIVTGWPNTHTEQHSVLL